MTGENKIKCPNCGYWNVTEDDAEQRCQECGKNLHDQHHIDRKNRTTGEVSFIDALPPYAKYIFIGLVSVIGGIIVLALA